MVMGLVMGKVDLSSAPDGNEREESHSSVSNSTASSSHHRKRKDNLRIVFHYLYKGISAGCKKLMAFELTEILMNVRTGDVK